MQRMSVIMLHNKQKVICHTLIIVVATVAIIVLGSSSAFALSLQSVIHQHNKVFDKKQQDGDSSSSSGSSDTKSSDKSNNEANNNNNIDKNYQRSTNDGTSNSGAHDKLQAVEPAETGKEGERVSGENIAPPTGT